MREISNFKPTDTSTRAPVWDNTARVEKLPETRKIGQDSASTRAPVCRNTARVDCSAQLKFPFLKGNTAVLNQHGPCWFACVKTPSFWVFLILLPWFSFPFPYSNFYKLSPNKPTKHTPKSTFLNHSNNQPTNHYEINYQGYLQIQTISIKPINNHPTQLYTIYQLFFPKSN